MRFTMTVDTESAAFGDDWPEVELTRIIHKVGDTVETGADEGKCLDVNGNTVGSWSLVESETTTETTTDLCRHCGRAILNANGVWVDPEATGDDRVWRETCDAHDTFQAEHEPI